MAAPSYYQVTLVAMDGSSNTSQVTLNTGASMVKIVRPASAGEIQSFPTAQTAIVYAEIVGQTERWRTALTATPYATINGVLTA